MSKKIPETPFETYLQEARYFDIDHFLRRHKDRGFLVSHGPVPTGADNIEQTQAVISPFAKTYTGSIDEVLISKHIDGSVVYEIPLDELRKPGMMGILPVGRQKSLPICINNPCVSDFHGFFRLKREQLYYVDDDSTHGTILNGQLAPSKQKVAVESGCQIIIAKSIPFTYYGDKEFCDVCYKLK
ncbi:FHA domain-containing protein [Candidatus Woesearchaeota archaeon]|nr:FHA domain-containing protein [Candidatus Woesearchaeota archaeon]